MGIARIVDFLDGTAENASSGSEAVRDMEIVEAILTQQDSGYGADER